MPQKVLLSTSVDINELRIYKRQYLSSVAFQTIFPFPTLYTPKNTGLEVEVIEEFLLNTEDGSEEDFINRYQQLRDDIYQVSSFENTLKHLHQFITNTDICSYYLYKLRKDLLPYTSKDYHNPLNDIFDSIDKIVKKKATEEATELIKRLRSGALKIHKEYY